MEESVRWKYGERRAGHWIFLYICYFSVGISQRKRSVCYNQTFIGRTTKRGMISVYLKGTGQAKTIFCIISQLFHVSTYEEKNPKYFKLKDIQGMLFLIYSMVRIFLKQIFIVYVQIYYINRNRVRYLYTVYTVQYTVCTVVCIKE